MKGTTGTVILGTKQEGMSTVSHNGRSMVVVQTIPRSQVTPSQPNTSWTKPAIGFGCIGIGTGLTYIIYQFTRLGNTSTSFSGIWGGLLILVAGCLGLAAGMKRSNNIIITMLILSIISCILSSVILPPIMGLESALLKIPSGETTAILLTLFLLGFTASLALSIISCVALCCSSPKKTPQQQFVMVASDGSVPGMAEINTQFSDREYTSLNRSHDLPPPYPGPLPGSNGVFPSAPPPSVRDRESAHIYEEILDSNTTGVYLHPPDPEYDDGYIKPMEAISQEYLEPV